MDSYPKKPCKYCGEMSHFPYMCRLNPKVQERAKRGLSLNRKTHKQWLLTRETWIRKNPPTIGGRYWPCYLKIHPLCRKKVDINTITLDHVVSRSRDPSRRHDLTNLKPCCWYCNTMKGSASIEQVENQYGVEIEK